MPYLASAGSIFILHFWRLINSSLWKLCRPTYFLHISREWRLTGVTTASGPRCSISSTHTTIVILIIWYIYKNSNNSPSMSLLSTECVDRPTVPGHGTINPSGPETCLINQKYNSYNTGHHRHEKHLPGGKTQAILKCGRNIGKIQGIVSGWVIRRRSRG